MEKCETETVPDNLDKRRGGNTVQRGNEKVTLEMERCRDGVWWWGLSPLIDCRYS